MCSGSLTRIVNEGLADIVNGGEPLYLARFPLLPVERWLAAGADKFTAEDAARSQQIYAAMQGAVDSWLDGHPRLKGDLVDRDGAALSPQRLGDVVFCAQLRLNTDSENDFTQLRDLLLECGSGIAPEVSIYSGR